MQQKTATYGTRTYKKPTQDKKGRRRLVQLLSCVVLFLVVFLGKGIAPESMRQSGEKLLELIRKDTDFAGAYSLLKETIAEEDLTVKQLAAVFTGSEEEETESAASVLYSKKNPAVLAARGALREIPTHEAILRNFGVEGPVVMTETEEVPEEEADQAEPGPEQATSSSVQVPEYKGPALPAGTTMEYCELGLSKVVTPVHGVLTSPYGYRDHPVNGEYAFHYGVDLAADTGTEIAAFADGKVEFIGESGSYGLYIQLDHGNGVKTFYCHCSKLCAEKGDQIQAGETIAKVGETGNATGPHLHFEMESNGVQLNPLYYIEIEG